MSKPGLDISTAEDEEIDIGLLSISTPLSPPSSAALSASWGTPLTPLAPGGIFPRRSLSRPGTEPSTPTSPMIGRSRTLPRARNTSGQVSPSGRTNSALHDLFMEPDKVTATNKWILGLAVVNFDLELGPVVDSIFPPLWLSSVEAENIAFSSFPDSLQFDQGSQTHSFRIRASRPSDESQAPSSAYDRPACDDGFIYGFSHFTQERDSSSKRGYLQRSLVILSHLPYPSLFSFLTDKLGPLYHAHGTPMLEAACHNIASWSAPTPGSSVELGFLGLVLQVSLPSGPDELQYIDPPAPATPGSDPVVHLTASLPSPTPPVLNLLEGSLSHLWSLWECLVLGEPLIIFAPSPAATSAVVWWLRDLLRPIPLAADFRPYFTIHDRDHARLANKQHPQLALILGVTNPFFARECAHWPHVLSLSGPDDSKAKTGEGKSKGGAALPPPGWTTKTHKRHISKDRALLARLETAARSKLPALQSEATRALREHFVARTAALLVPLNRYLATLLPPPPSSSQSPISPSIAASFSRTPRAIPSNASLSSMASGASTSGISNVALSPTASPTPPAHSPGGSAPGPRLRPFSTSAFLASLSAAGAPAPLPFKSSSRRKDFYARWVRSPAFALWLARQEELVRATF